MSEITAEKVRNGSPVKINEFRVNAGSPDNLFDSFIELYNAGTSAVDVSNWTLTQHQTQQPIFSAITIPAGTKLASRGFYLLGLSNSGLAVPARAGDTTIHVRNRLGMTVGDEISIDREDGQVARFTVDRVDQVPKKQFPADAGGLRVDLAQKAKESLVALDK